MANCGDCIYFRAWKDKKRGLCQRYAPHSGGAGFPVQEADDWCGDHAFEQAGAAGDSQGEKTDAIGFIHTPAPTSDE